MRTILLFAAFLLLHSLQAQTELQFSGMNWEVKQGIGGPGPNNWSGSPETVWVDYSGNLHMKIRKIGNTWYCSEIVSQKSYGYGEYRFTISGRLELFDPNCVTGLFLYESDTAETDIEFSRWGNPSGKDGWFTVQPPGPETQRSFQLNTESGLTTHLFRWTSDSIFFQSYRGHSPTLPAADSLIAQWTYKGSHIQSVGMERLHINFWLMGGQPPLNQQEAELVVGSVSVTAASSVSDGDKVISWSVYPDAAKRSIRIGLPFVSGKNSILVYNPSGILLMKMNPISRITQLDTGNLPPGLYFIEWITNEKKSIKKLIIQ